MFGEDAKTLVQTLKHINNKKDLTDEEKRKKIIKFTTNYPKLMSFNCIQWNDFLDGYVNDFVSIVKEDIEKLPYLRETEQNNEEYFKQRSIIYSYRVYNPETKKYEYKDLSQILYGRCDGKSNPVDVREHPEVLAEYVDVEKVFQTDIAEMNKLLKLRRVRDSLTYKQFNKKLLIGGKKLFETRFRRSIASQKANYVQQKVYDVSTNLTM